MRAIAKGLGFLVLCVGLNAQQNTDTVWATLVTGYHGSIPATFPIPGATQIGQATHITTAGIRNNGGNTCTSPLLSLSLQVSEDNVTYFIPNGNNVDVSPGVVSGSYVSMRQYRLNGSYPYVRASVGGFDNTNCVVDVFYFGNKVAIPFTASNTNSTFFSANTSGDHLVLNVAVPVCIRGIILWNVTAAQTITLKYGTANAISFGPFTSIPAGTLLNFPQVPDPGSAYFCTSVASGVTLTLGANTEVDGILYYYF